VTAMPSEGAGLSVDFAASISAAIGPVADELKRARQDRQALLQAVKVIPQITLPQITASGVPLDYPELLSPRSGQAWIVRRVTAATFSAGTVTMYVNGVADSNIIVVFPQAGTYTFGNGEIILMPGQRFIFEGSGLTGNVSVSLGVIEVEQRWLAAYLF
jgi:hypothetical protein